MSFAQTLDFFIPFHLIVSFLSFWKEFKNLKINMTKGLQQVLMQLGAVIIWVWIAEDLDSCLKCSSVSIIYFWRLSKTMLLYQDLWIRDGEPEGLWVISDLDGLQVG